MKPALATPRVDVDYLTSNRSDPGCRMVLEDWQRERGEMPTRLGVALWIADANANAYADADANADAGAYANAYANADANAYANRFLREEPDMRNGLVLIKTPGYYGGPTRVGWLRRVSGDLYELLPGFRSVSRESGSRELAEVAGDGPAKDHKLGVPSKVAEDINAFLVWRAVRADEKAWAKECPRPKGWTE